jgi:hypothetical protein
VKDGGSCDLNVRPDWKTLPEGYGPIGDDEDGLNPARGTTLRSAAGGVPGRPRQVDAEVEGHRQHRRTESESAPEEGASGGGRGRSGGCADSRAHGHVGQAGEEGVPGPNAKPPDPANPPMSTARSYTGICSFRGSVHQAGDITVHTTKVLDEVAARNAGRRWRRC